MEIFYFFYLFCILHYLHHLTNFTYLNQNKTYDFFLFKKNAIEKCHTIFKAHKSQVTHTYFFVEYKQTRHLRRVLVTSYKKILSTHLNKNKVFTFLISRYVPDWHFYELSVLVHTQIHTEWIPRLSQSIFTKLGKPNMYSTFFLFLVSLKKLI